MKRVIIESPFAGDIDLNIRYARRCLLDSLKRNEAPIASHLLHTQVLDDEIPGQRTMGVNAGFAWYGSDVLVTFYVDLGMSQGMNDALAKCEAEGIEFEFRRLR